MSPKVLSLTLALGALLAAPAARADHYFLFPQVGVGYGGVAQGSFRDWVGKLDLTLGQEYDLGGPRGAVGWMLGFAVTSNAIEEGEQLDPPPEYLRLEFAPMVTLSSGYNWWTLFARVSAGPHVAYTKIGGVEYVGGGLQLELAVGSKNIVELFTQAYGTVDARGAAITVVGGLRLNAIAFVALADLFSGSGSSHRKYRPSHDDGPHRAVPAPPR